MPVSSATRRQRPQPPRTLLVLALLTSLSLLCSLPAASAQSLPVPSVPAGFALPVIHIGVCVPPPLADALSAGISLRLLQDAQYAEAGIRVGLELLRTSARIAIHDIVEQPLQIQRVDLRCDDGTTDANQTAQHIAAAITESGVHVIVGGVGGHACTALALAAANTSTPWISYFCDHAATDGVQQPLWPAEWTSTVSASGAGSTLGIRNTAALGAPFGPTLFYRLNPTSVDHMSAVMDLYLRLQWLYPWSHDSQDQTQISLLYSTQTQGENLALEPLTEMLQLVNSQLAVVTPFDRTTALSDRQACLRSFLAALQQSAADFPNTQMHMVVLFLHSGDALAFMETAHSIEGWWTHMTAAPIQIVMAGTAWTHILTDSRSWNQTAEAVSTVNGTEFASVDWNVLDGLMGVSPVPGYFTTKREFAAAVAQVGDSVNVTGDASSGVPVLTQVDWTSLPKAYPARLGYDAVSVVFRALCEFADSLLQLRPSQLRMSFLLAGAISRSSFVGATGAIRFRRDSARLGDRQTIRFAYSQLLLSNWSMPPSPAGALPLGAGLPYAIVGQWSPTVGNSLYQELVENTTMTRVMLSALYNPRAVLTPYQPLQRYADQFWTALRLHSEPPSARSSACFVVINLLQRAFLVGGTASEVLGGLADVYELSFATEQWSRRAVVGSNTPSARYNAACSTFEQELMMFGGQNLNAIHSDLWAFSLRKNTWRLIIPDGVVLGRARTGLLFDPSSLGRLLLWGGTHEQDPTPGLYIFQPHNFAVSSMLPVARAELPPIAQSLVALEADFVLPNAIARFLRLRNYKPSYNATMIAFSYINCSSQVDALNGAGLNVAQGRALLEAQCSSTSPDAVRNALAYLSTVDEINALSTLSFGMGGYGTPLTIGGRSYYALISSLALALLFDINTNQIHPFPLRCPPNVYGGVGFGIGSFAKGNACPLGTDFTFFDTREDGIIFVGNGAITKFANNVTCTEMWQLDLHNCVATNADETTTIDQLIATAALAGNSTCGLWSLVASFGGTTGMDARATAFFDSNLVMFGGYTQSGPSNALDVLQTDPDVVGPTSRSKTPITNRLQADHVTPPPRHSHSMVLWGAQLIVFGGLVLETSSASALLQQAQQSGHQLQATNQLFIYNITSQRWQVQQPINAPPGPTFEHVAFMLREAMYIFGGIDPDGTFLNSLYMFSPATNEWTLLGPVHSATATNDSVTSNRTNTGVSAAHWPSARASAIAFVVSDSSAFVGFGLGPTGNELGDLWSYTFHSPDCALFYLGVAVSTCLSSQWQPVRANSSYDRNPVHARPPHAEFVTQAPAVSDAAATFVDQLSWLLVFGGSLQSNTTATRSYFLCELVFQSDTGSSCTWFRIPLPDDWPLPLEGATAVVLWPFALVSGGAIYDSANFNILRLNLITFEWDDLEPQRKGIRAGHTSAAAATRILTQSWVPVRPLINAVAVEYANGAFYHGGYSASGVGTIGAWDRNSLVAELFFLGANIACPTAQINGTTVKVPMAGSRTAGFDNCTECSAGTFPARGWCYPCPAGTFRSSKSAACVACRAGTYGSIVGARWGVACTPCAAGTTQNRTAQTSCDPCPSGQSCLFQSSTPLASQQSLQLLPLLGIPVIGTTLPLPEGAGIDTEAAVIIGIIVAIVALALIVVYGCLQWSFRSDDGFQKVAFFFNGAHSNRLSNDFWARKMQELAPQGREKTAISIERATAMGGLFSMFCLLLFVFFIVTLSVTYGRDNVHEERSLIPATEGLSTDIVVGVRVVLTLYSVTPPVPLASWCVRPPSDGGGCWTGTTMSFSQTDFKIDSSRSLQSYRKCTETLMPGIEQITQCRIEFFNPAVSVLRGVVPVVVTVTRQSAYALGFDWEIAFDSGLPGIGSSVKSGLRTDGSRVLRGMSSPSHINLTLTPTRYQGVSAADTSAGFLVQLNDQQIGRSLLPSEFHSDQGLRVAFSLQQSAATLHVTKRKLQSFTQFVSALLGALSGVVGVLAFLMNKTEAGENRLLRWLSRDKPQGHPAVRRWENSAEWQLYRARPDLVQAEISRKSTVGADRSNGAMMAMARGSVSQPGFAPMGKTGSTTNLHTEPAARLRSFTKLQPARAPSVIMATNPLLLANARGSVSSAPPVAVSESHDLSAESIEMSDVMVPVNRRFTELSEAPTRAADSATGGAGSGASAAMSTPNVPRASFAMHRGSVLSSPSKATAAAASVHPAADSRPQFVRSNSLALPVQRSVTPRSSVSFADPAAAAAPVSVSVSDSGPGSAASPISPDSVSRGADANRSMHMPLVEESAASDDIGIDLAHDGMLNRRPTHRPDNS